MAQEKQGRNFNCVLYLPEDHLSEKLVNDHWEKIDWFAFIVHDKDLVDALNPNVLKKRHIHLCLRTFNPLSIRTIKNWLYDPDTNDKALVQFAQDMPAACRYLMHLDHPNKYQYPLSEVHYTKENFETYIHSVEKDTDPLANCLLDVYNNWSESDLVKKYGRIYIQYRYHIESIVKQIRKENELFLSYQNYIFERLSYEYWKNCESDNSQSRE